LCCLQQQDLSAFGSKAMSFGAAGTREVAQMLQEQLPLAVGRFDQCFGRMGISFAKTDRWLLFLSFLRELKTDSCNFE